MEGWAAYGTPEDHRRRRQADASGRVAGGACAGASHVAEQPREARVLAQPADEPTHLRVRVRVRLGLGLGLGLGIGLGLGLELGLGLGLG